MNMCISVEKEEHLTELLVDLYESWKSCTSACGTVDDKKDVFFDGIRRHLSKGFSILSEPGIYNGEVVLERLTNDLYKKWQGYIQAEFEDIVGMGYEDDIDLSISTFIVTARIKLDKIQMKEGDTVFWRYIDIKVDN